MLYSLHYRNLESDCADVLVLPVGHMYNLHVGSAVAAEEREGWDSVKIDAWTES